MQFALIADKVYYEHGIQYYFLLRLHAPKLFSSTK